MREQYEYTFLTGEWRVGQALKREEKAPGGQPYQATSNQELRVAAPATIAEKVGNRMMGWRLQMIAPLGIEALNSLIKECHQREKQATLTGVVKILRAEESAMRRLDSMTAPSSNSMDLRTGDCRLVLSDIEDDSIPLIMTDPPYEDGAEPLWRGVETMRGGNWTAASVRNLLAPIGWLVRTWKAHYVASPAAPRWRGLALAAPRLRSVGDALRSHCCRLPAEIGHHLAARVSLPAAVAWLVRMRWQRASATTARKLGRLRPQRFARCLTRSAGICRTG